jgi:hypothetical protein
MRRKWPPLVFRLWLNWRVSFEKKNAGFPLFKN